MNPNPNQGIIMTTITVMRLNECVFGKRECFVRFFVLKGHDFGYLCGILAGLFYEGFYADPR